MQLSQSVRGERNGAGEVKLPVSVRSNGDFLPWLGRNQITARQILERRAVSWIPCPFCNVTVNLDDLLVWGN